MQSALNKDFDVDDTRFYIKDFIAAESITMIYSPTEQGKTWLSLAISHEIMSTQNGSVDELIYFDLDNSRRNAKKRNLESVLNKYPKWEYYLSCNIDMDKEEILQSLNDDCYNMNYTNKVLIFDSVRDFIEDTSSDKQAKYFMSIMKNIRDNGGTIILVHHTTKNSKSIEGSGDFKKSADNLFRLEQKNRINNLLQLYLHQEKARDDVVDCAFEIDTSKLSISPMDSSLASMSEYENEFVRKALSALKKDSNGLNKTEVIEATGHQKSDNTARDTLDKFTDKYWNCEKVKNRFFYTLIN